MELSPEAIVARHKDHNKKTAIIDYVDSGGGLASFLAVLFHCASQSNINFEDLEQSLSITVLTDTGGRGDIKNFETIRILDEGITIHCDNKIILESSFIQSLTLKNARFIPHYSREEWANPPQDISHNADVLDVVQTLGEYIQTLEI